jgi:hypothetical protein
MRPLSLWIRSWISFREDLGEVVGSTVEGESIGVAICLEEGVAISAEGVSLKIGTSLEGMWDPSVSDLLVSISNERTEADPTWEVAIGISLAIKKAGSLL